MFFDRVLEVPPDPVFGLSADFQADSRIEKVNLLLGVYKNEQLQSELIPAVKKAKILVQDLGVDYLSIDGLQEFCELLGPLIFGDKNWTQFRENIYGAQSVGGTSALYLGALFLNKEVTQNIAISNFTWANHRSIFERAGCSVLTYSYYNEAKHGFDLEMMRASLMELPEKTAVILQAVCHNPTGCDPSIEEWKEISKIMLERRLIPFFDFAYQGFGDGLEEDAQSIRIFQEAGHEMLVAYSCSKNFSLYCQRVGALFVIHKNHKTRQCVSSQLKRIIRAVYSNPPAHGARIVTHVLSNVDLKKEWEADLANMRNRLNLMRDKLIQKLSDKAKNMDFHFLSNHKGMFSFLNLDRTIVKKMMDEFAIYMIGNGRMNVAGLTDKNIDYVVDSLVKVCGSINPS